MSNKCKLSPAMQEAADKAEAERWTALTQRCTNLLMQDKLPALTDLAYASQQNVMIERLTATAWDRLSRIALPKEYFKLLGKHEQMQLRYRRMWAETVFMNDCIGMIVKGRDIGEMLEDGEEIENEDEPIQDDEEAEESEYSEDSALLSMLDEMGHYVDACREFAYEQFKLRELDIGEVLFEVSQKEAWMGHQLISAFDGQTSHVLWKYIDGTIRPCPVSDLFPLKAWLDDEPMRRLRAWKYQEEEDAALNEDDAGSPEPRRPSVSPEMTLAQIIQEQHCEGTLLGADWNNHQTVEDEEA